MDSKKLNGSRVGWDLVITMAWSFFPGRQVMWSVKDSNCCSYFPLQGRNIVVFYGSQTGTGEEFANRLSKDAQRYGMKGMAADPEEYDMVTNNISISGFIWFKGTILGR